MGEVRTGVQKGITEAIGLLTQTADMLEEELRYSAPAVPSSGGSKEPALSCQESRDVFVVHGHDEGAKESVARFLTKADFRPVILHEQANGGRTVIEKLERYSQVGFAVVILSPDDVGGPSLGSLQPRARQNVIAELFYFIGKLGRDRVCALMVGEVEIPSDIVGVVYVQFDDRGAWKTDILKEFKALGYDFDWGKALS